MTDINPTPSWAAVRQLEIGEFALGGANGNMNEQAKSLAARSELLKQYAALPYESKTGGYALNERVQIATGDIVRSTIASNVNNPNVDMTGWVPTIPVATETVAGTAKIATTAIAQAGTDDTDFLTAKKLRDALNATGDAPVYGFRGFVRVLADGTVASSKGAIASVSKVSAGNYLITINNQSNSPLFPLVTTSSVSDEFGIIAVAESPTTVRVYGKNTYSGFSVDQPFTLGVNF